VIRALPWDSEFFGFPVGTVEGGTEAHELQAFECVYWLADVNDDRPAALGFTVVDERVTLERTHFENRGTASPCERWAGGRCPPALVHVARTSHTDSRFFQDLRFPRERCEELFQRWLERDFTNNLAWTIHRDGEPAGYITLVVHEDSTSIGLLGVVERHRGHGLAKALISQALVHSAHLGLPCKVVTQGRNAAALKAYTSVGFTEVQRQAWWHWWR
jgi:dTDP-4-amino-4,6-dideoxy-D-galactose acyltransferase